MIVQHKKNIMITYWNANINIHLNKIQNKIWFLSEDTRNFGIENRKYIARR